MSERFDFLVIGSGISGLTFALDAAEHGSVAVVTKRRADDSNTNYAQGGIAAVVSNMDSFESHVADTLDSCVIGIALSEFNRLLCRVFS